MASPEKWSSIFVPVWPRERVSKSAKLSVIETAILSSSAKLYLGAKVQSLREKQPERERSCLPTTCRSPELQCPRSQNTRFSPAPDAAGEWVPESAWRREWHCKTTLSGAGPQPVSGLPLEFLWQAYPVSARLRVRIQQCLLSGVKRTSCRCAVMSADDPKRTCHSRASLDLPSCAPPLSDLSR
jgi:hypothetical protein